MNFNKVKKILLVLMLGIVAFLINGVEARANTCTFTSSNGNGVTCEVKTSDTKIYSEQCKLTVKNLKVADLNTTCSGAELTCDIQAGTGNKICTLKQVPIHTCEYTADNGATCTVEVHANDYTVNNCTFKIYDLRFADFADGKCPTLNLKCSNRNGIRNWCEGTVESPLPQESKECTEDQQKEISSNYYRMYVEGTNERFKNLTSSITGMNNWDELTSRLNGTDAEGAAAEYDNILNTMVTNFVSVLSSVDCAPSEDYINSLADRLKNVLKAMKNEALEEIQQHIRTLELQGKVPEEDQEDAIDVIDNLEQALDNSIDEAVSTIKTRWLAESGIIYVDDNPISCNGLLGKDVLDDISKVLTWIKIGVPILLIVLGTLDFGKAVLADDDKALSKATRTFIMRCIAAVAVFFAPIIIMYLIELVDDLAGGCDISDLYGVILWKI